MKIVSAGLAVIVSIFLIALGGQWQCLADNADDHVAFYASNSVAPFLVVGELSLLAGGPNGKKEAIQGAKALVATCAATELLKITVREKRPNSDSTSSFPSGHTSAAFAMATLISDYRPNYTVLSYGVAAVIGWSRVERGAHRVHDVIAGALLGHYTAKFFANEHIAPTANGMAFQWKW